MVELNGKKILVTGNGKCDIMCDTDGDNMCNQNCIGIPEGLIDENGDLTLFSKLSISSVKTSHTFARYFFSCSTSSDVII